MSMNLDPVELHRLFVAKTDGTISAEDHERLSILLKSSAEIRRQWFAFQDAESALLAWALRESVRREEGAGINAPPTAVSSERSRSQARSASWKYISTLAAGIAIGLVAWGTWLNYASRPSSDLITSDEATTSSVAVLSRGVNMDWEGSADGPAVNTPLAPGLLRLKSGVAEIEFFQGARLCLEGPAEIQLVSAGEAYCRYGRFSAHVPPQAKGFRIGTPKGDIVDLGTDFGLNLSDEASEVHVFKGEVELHQPQTAMVKLTTGKAAGMGQDGASRALTADETAFTFSRDLDAHVSASGRDAFQRWEEASAQWNKRPNLRLRLDFQDQKGSRSLSNQATHGGSIAAGSIVGCVWTEGRWPGKQALQFRSVSDRVRLSIPEEYRQLTLAAWVQVHSLTSRQSSLFMCEGWETGDMHWQVLPDGSLCLGVASGPQAATDDYISPTVFTPERLGQWMHLAVVYDTVEGQVNHYVNGKRVSSHRMRHRTPLQPGLAELGNWNPSAKWQQRPVRNLVGSMEDFSLWAKALNDEEMRQLAK